MEIIEMAIYNRVIQIRSQTKGYHMDDDDFDPECRRQWLVDCFGLYPPEFLIKPLLFCYNTNPRKLPEIIGESAQPPRCPLFYDLFLVFMQDDKDYDNLRSIIETHFRQKDFPLKTIFSLQDIKDIAPVTQQQIDKDLKRFWSLYAPCAAAFPSYFSCDTGNLYALDN